MEELVNTYRSSVLSLCSDGEMRNALSNIKNPDLKAYANQQSSNRSWIEREIAIIKRSYDNEIHLLESEIKDLRSKLQQSLTFMSELRSRFEDNLKSLYKSNKDSDTDILIKEIERLNFSIETLEKSALMLRDQLSMEHQNSRTRHHKLIECLVETLQTKDAAIAAVQRIEEYCMQTGLDHVKEFSLLQTELDYTKKYSGHQSAERKNDIDLLLRSLIGVDHDSNEIERKSNISNNSVDICNAHDSFDNDDKLIKKFKSKANYSSPMKSGRDGNFPAEVMASKPFIVKHADNIFQSPTVKQTKSFKK
jgi:predicted RNase H-like nuclease (RuvC/YqgF family)